MSHDNFYTTILENNKKWSAGKLRKHKEQSSPVLWIGCADNTNSQIINQPGEVIVHNTPGNLVVSANSNMLGVVDYAVNVLKIKHIIICGHYGCSSVKAAIENDNVVALNTAIADVYNQNSDELDTIEDETARLNALIEANVREQVSALAHSDVVQRLWQTGDELHLHGCVYSTDCSEIKDLDINISGNDDLDKISSLLTA